MNVNAIFCSARSCEVGRVCVTQGLGSECECDFLRSKILQSRAKVRYTGLDNVCECDFVHRKILQSWISLRDTWFG